MSKENKIKSIGSHILGSSEYEQLTTFFLKVWNSNCDFIVLITPRCNVLHNMFLQANTPRLSTVNRCVTDNALLLYASHFAKHYKENGAFPTVVLVEDVLSYGTNIVPFLNIFEGLIIEDIKSRFGLSAGAQHSLHHNLRNAIKLYAYAMEEVSVFFEGIYCKKIEAETRRAPAKLNELSLKISDFIQKANVPNTSFQFSIEVPTNTALTEENKFNWVTIPWHYRGVKQAIYFPINANEGDFITAVYAHGLDSYNSNGQIWLTGVPILGDITKSDLDKVCNIIKLSLENANSSSEFKWLTWMMELKQDNLQKQKAQLVYFLLSVIAVHKFCKDCSIGKIKEYHISGKSNVKYVAMNFGRYDDAWNDIESLCTNEELLYGLQKKLYEEFNEITEPLTGDTQNWVTSFVAEGDIKTINGIIEDIFYRAGIARDKDSYAISCNNKILHPNICGPDIVLLTDVLFEVNAQWNRSGKPANMCGIFAGQIALTDSGLMSIDFEYYKDSDKIKCTLSAGKLSTFVLPRRLRLFIPSLIYIERNRFGLGIEANELVKEFVQSLLKTNHNIETEAECDAFTTLKEYGMVFVDDLYQSGQRVRYWDIELFTDRDWIELRKDSDMYLLDIMMHNQRRQYYYVDQAKDFIKMKFSQRGY